ncbi:MAG: methyl-accepting chemotaxis protein [Gammaproteobacteria bacterium]|nr:methyl-accepting chemotaxis protein [Gammaproteobacteria bacterium]
MANKLNVSSTFRIIAIVAALLLLAAAALIYSRAGGSDTATAEIAALSQAIPAQARTALEGQAGGFDRLDSSLKRLAQLRRAAGQSLPGSSSAWQQLESRATSVLAKRADVETLNEAGALIAASVAPVLQLSNELLDRAGSVGVVQEFQQRAARIGQTVTRLSTSPNAATLAASLVDDVSFLRTVADALAGQDTALDLRPLGDTARQSLLAPLQGHISDIEGQIERIGGSVNQVSGLDGLQGELAATADGLQSAFSGASSGARPGWLQTAWLPLGLILLALILLAVLVLLNARSSVFERAAKEQAEQNERNQQAILRLLDEMGSLADGDLTVEATVTEDITGTIADSFNYAIEELRKLVATVNETAIMVDSAAKQTETTAANMAKAAENQSQEINAATESIVSMAASIEEVSGNAERSSDVARHSVEVAHKGGEAVRRTIDGMNTIRETIQDTSKRIKRLGESSQEIGNIVELINDIAEQTNILALNASIQASMAGEAGRGFAVVADEVQRLAERSTNATKQIEVLVRTIQADTNEAVVSMERSTTDVVGGALLAENAGAALDEIEQVSNQIASLVQNISGSARQQAGSAADVTRRTTRLREISEQTGKATTATAAAISKLSELASQLRKTVAGFSLPSSALQASALSPPASTVSSVQQANEQVRTG